MGTRTGTRKLVPSVNRAIDIIFLLHTSGELPLKKIASQLEMPLSTCYNIVSTLEYRGIIQKDDSNSNYSLGLTLFQWGLQFYNEIDVRKVSIPYLHKLVEEFDESATLSIFNRITYESVVVAKVESTQILRTTPQIGAGYPAYGTAGGKCFLSNLSTEELDTFFRESNSFLNSGLSEEKLRIELEEIKKTNVAVTVNELGNDAATVGAAIKNNEDKVIATLTMSGPVDRMTEKIPAMKQSITRAANEISSHMFNRGLL